MPLDRNNSNIRKQTKVFNISQNTQFSARTIVRVESKLLDSSIEAGDVIHYDTISRTYIRSFADLPPNAEVFGILESFNSDGSGNVVTNGSVTINSSKLINISGTNSGGNDIYFLSGISAGKLQNCGSTLYGHIIKPIYQVAPHNQYTGIFRNYLGYVNETGSLLTSRENLIIAGNTTNNKFLIYNPLTQAFFVKNASYNLATGKYTFSNLYSSSIFSIPPVQFAYNQDYDATLSDDGRHILIFAKALNKVYHIYIDPDDSNKFKVKATLDVNLQGTSDDKIWAADHEAGSFVVSTKALNRIPSTNHDVRHLSPSISSKIKYYKRSIGTTRPFIWRKTHENHAFGFTKDDKTDTLQITENEITFRDSVFYTTGIYRTNDIRCHRKNYTLSTIALKDDQISYKSKDSSLRLPRYSSINIPAPRTSMTVFYGITGSIKTTAQIQSSEIYCSDYAIPDRKYALNGHNKSFLINAVFSDGEYREDNSYKNLYGFLCTNAGYGPGIGLTAFYSPTGGNETKHLNFARLENGALGASLFPNIGTESVDTNGTQNICSSSYTTSTSAPTNSDVCVVAKLYNLNTDDSKRLIIYKYPFYTYSLDAVFDYFELDPLYSPPSVPPATDSSGNEIYGYLKHFKTSDISELNSMNYMKIFGNTTISFIFTTSYVIVFTHIGSSFIKINLNEDFTKAKHIYTLANNFFILNSKIYRYNSTKQSLDPIEIINL